MSLKNPNYRCQHNLCQIKKSVTTKKNSAKRKEIEEKKEKPPVVGNLREALPPWFPTSKCDRAMILASICGDIESGSGGESDGDGSKKYYCQCEKCVIF